MPGGPDARIAHVLDGVSRAEAARLCGMDRQALRDGVARFNAEGLGGLVDRPRPGREPRLSEGEQAALAGLILRGPDPERSGLSSWTLADLCHEIEASWGKRSHPGKRITLWFQDEARVGQKGRTCHRWWLKGQRPPGLYDRRFTWMYMFAAIQPATGESTTLVLAEVSTEAMSLFLERFSAERRADEHAVMVLDQAGWHGARALRIPGNVTLVPLPPCAPELDPVERVWLHLRERFLSHRLLDDHDAIVDACCAAWDRLTPERLRFLCSYPYIQQVNC